MEPRLVGIKGGWAAVGKYWAVFGETKEDALRNFYNAEARHTEIALRDVKSQTEASPQVPSPSF